MNPPKLITIPLQLTAGLLALVLMACAVGGQFVLAERYADAGLPGQAPLAELAVRTVEVMLHAS